MRRYGLLALIFVVLRCSAGEPAVRGWLQPALEKVERNQKPSESVAPLQLQAARNEYESFQLVLSARQTLPADVALDFADPLQSAGARIRAENLQVRLARYVSFLEPADPARKYDRLRAPGALPVKGEAEDEPAPNRARPGGRAAGSGAADRNWVRRETLDLLENETGFTYDPGAGVKRGHIARALTGEGNTVLWITLYVPAGAEPGDYEGRIHIGVPLGGTGSASAGGGQARQTLVYGLKVRSFVLPKFASFPLTADPPRGGARYSRSFADQDFFSHRATLRHLGVDPELSFDKDDGPVVEWSAFDRRASYVIGELGMRGFQVPYAYVVGGHGDVARNLRPGLKEGEYVGMLKFGGYLGVPYYPDDPQFARYHDPKRGGPDGMDETFQRRFRNYLAAFARHTKETGWFDAFYVNVFDEPLQRSYGQLRSLARLAKQADADYKVTAMGALPHPALVGYFQAWNGYYRPGQRDINVDLLRERQDFGERVRSGNPWYDWMINRSPVWVRAFLWWAWVERLDGLGSYTIADWRQLKLDGENNPAADGNFTPEDSWKTMVYPPPKGADQYRSSVRWEMTREGLEDYEWFLLLRDALLRSGMGAARARDEVSRLLQQVIRPDWSRVDDPRLMEPIRSQIAAQIEADRTP